jgi:hypothetical protein
MIATNDKSTFLTGQNWGIGDASHTKAEVKENSKHIVEAYLRGLNDGKKKGQKELKASIMEKFTKNIDKAKEIGEIFYTKIDNAGISCFGVHLSAETVNDFKLLIVVDEPSYLSKKFDEFYKLSIKERKKANIDGYHISISFTVYTENLNRKKIFTDGYYYSYNVKDKK